MAPLDVLRNEWIILALAAGGVLTLVIVLTYLMMWRPRPPQGAPPVSDWRGIWQYTPWVLVLTILGIMVFGLVETICYSIWPPNW
jgi:hypothetical protein